MDKADELNPSPALTVVKRGRGRPKGVKNGQATPPTLRPAFLNAEGKPVDEQGRRIGYGFGGSTPDNTGPKSQKPWKDALRKAIATADGKVLRRLADALVKKAAEGDVAALKEIGDRLDGRSVQQIEQKTDAVIRVFTDDANL